jgi:hypothetical protein
MAECRVEQGETAAGLRSCWRDSLQLLASTACNARLEPGKRNAQRLERESSRIEARMGRDKRSAGSMAKQRQRGPSTAGRRPAGKPPTI